MPQNRPPLSQPPRRRWLRWVLLALLLWAGRCTYQALTPPPTDTAPQAAAASDPLPDIPPPPTPKPFSDGELALLDGDFDPERHPLFQPIPKPYANKTAYVQNAVFHDLINMMQHARKDGITLEVVSAFRSYRSQKTIWERKWHATSGSPHEKTAAAMAYSAFPGTSRHHWGTDIDFNSTSLRYWNSENGRKIHAWLTENALRYGFCQTYQDKDGRHGHENEPWHWSHITTAEPLRRRRLESLAQIFRYDIAGIDTLTPADMAAVVDGIADECRL